LVVKTITIDNFFALHRNLASFSPPQKNIFELGYFFGTFKVKKTLNLNFCSYMEPFDTRKLIILVAEIITIDNFLALRQNLASPSVLHKNITGKKGGN